MSRSAERAGILNIVAFIIVCLFYQICTDIASSILFKRGQWDRHTEYYFLFYIYIYIITRVRKFMSSKMTKKLALMHSKLAKYALQNCIYTLQKFKTMH